MTILSTDPNLAYSDLTANGEPTNYKVFVNFTDDNGFVETDEIDVAALTPGHAREVAQAALARDYEPGGKIVHVETLVDDVLCLACDLGDGYPKTHSGLGPNCPVVFP